MATETADREDHVAIYCKSGAIVGTTWAGPTAVSSRLAGVDARGIPEPWSDPQRSSDADHVRLEARPGTTGPPRATHSLLYDVDRPDQRTHLERPVATCTADLGTHDYHSNEIGARPPTPIIVTFPGSGHAFTPRPTGNAGEQ